MFVIECKYPKRNWKTIASFRTRDDAYAYTARHNGDGGGKLRVIRDEDYISAFTYQIHVKYGRDTTLYPLNIGFISQTEAEAYVHREELWNGGTLHVVKQFYDDTVT